MGGPALPASAEDTAQGQAAASQHLDINEYRVDGAHLLTREKVEEAVYPFLGPGRTTADVEQARAALEKVYYALGYQTVAVEIPPQQVGPDGVVILKVTEGAVGRLRVVGARYFSPDDIKREAPSLTEGTVPNFNDVSRDIVGLNQIPDRRVTPTLRAGVAPGTVDVDLNVQDTLPLHGNLEFNNRYSQNTKPWRLTATLHYDNLWQLGHSLSLTYQVAPQNPRQVEAFSGSYLARVPQWNSLSFLLYGVKNDSNVATIGGTDVVGRGQIIGTRALIAVPGEEGLFQTISLGFDYKHFDQEVTQGGNTVPTPITYFPATASYTAVWQGDDAQTQLDTSITFHLRGLGSGGSEFDAQRFNARGDFVYFRGDLSRTQNLPLDLQLYGKVQGQIASDPLVSTEELSAGGLDTVRGYLESEVLGDNGALGLFEFRSPSLAPVFGSYVNEWRFYLFGDGGALSIYSPLPEQQSRFHLASVGVGSRVRMLDHLNGSFDFALPLIRQIATPRGDPRLTFRAWGDF